MNFPSRFRPFGTNNNDVKRFTSNRKNKRLSGSQRRKLSKLKKRDEFKTSNWSDRSWNKSYNEPYNSYFPISSFQMSYINQPCPYFEAPPINFEHQFNSQRSDFSNFHQDNSNFHQDDSNFHQDESIFQNEMPKSNFQNEMPKSNFQEELPKPNFQDKMPKSNFQEEMPKSNFQEEMPKSNFQDKMPESKFPQESFENQNQLSSTPKVEKDLTNKDNQFNEDNNTSESTELFLNPFYENIKADDIPFKVKVTVVNGQLNNSLTEKQGRIVQSKIVEAVDSISLGGFAPQFVKSFFLSDGLYIVCANNQTVTWLSNTVKRLTNLWEGAKLRVVLPFTEKKKTVIRVPSHDSPGKILRRFSIQNPDLRINCWTLIGRKFHKGGQTLFLLIDIYSLNKIKAANYKVFWGMGTVVFKIVEKSKKKVNEQNKMNKVGEDVANNQENPLQNN